MTAMANRAYVSFWSRDYSEALMLDRFERLLETVPLSATRPGFTRFVVRAISSAETPIIEHDLRGVTASAPDLIALAREHRNPDTAYEVEGYWDLWQRNAEDGSWQRGPEPLLFTCHGEEYDNGISTDFGHFLADLGFEHFYTGHGGLLGTRGSRSAPADPVEAEFLAWMTDDAHLHEYYEKTRENILQLTDWVRAVEKALPIERTRLWSEGEENLEARLDEILAVH
jgi:hypothetical protein